MLARDEGRERLGTLHFGIGDILSGGGMNRNALKVLLISSFLTGCATVDQRVDILYKPVVHDATGSGTLYLAQVEGQNPGGGGPAPVQWILGEVKNEDGEKVASVVTDTAPADLVTDAFTQEFKAAGYTVLPTQALTAEVAKGINLSSVTIRLSEVSSLLKADAKGTIDISVEVWRDGRKLRKLDYEADYSDSAVTGREQLLPDTLQKVVQAIMKRAVPEINKLMEQR